MQKFLYQALESRSFMFTILYKFRNKHSVKQSQKPV